MVHILLIEPDRLQARVYSAALERHDAMVVHVTTAQAAVQAADEQAPDVVVLELQLLGHNGVEFLYEFRSYLEWLEVPIIVHTFVPTDELVRAATLEKELGVRRVLYKPATTLAGLCRAVQDVVPVRS
jgi:DNA-binding response OmpR family regulator